SSTPTRAVCPAHSTSACWPTRRTPPTLLPTTWPVCATDPAARSATDSIGTDSIGHRPAQLEVEAYVQLVASHPAGVEQVSGQGADLGGDRGPIEGHLVGQGLHRQAHCLDQLVLGALALVGLGEGVQEDVDPQGQALDGGS